MTYAIITRQRPTMYFFGVTTGASSSMRMFPDWMRILGKEADLVGVDLPLNASVEQYRAAVYQIKRDPLSLGAVVTSHKLNVLNAARDLFDDLSDDAALCAEVGCIYKRGGRLVGHAVDPTTSARSMAQFIAPGYWGRHQADVLCLGAGGAAVAIVVHFILRAAPEDRPRRMTIVDIQPDKLDHLSALVMSLPDSGIDFEFICQGDAVHNNRLMAALPPRSMVINATGMGKDRPGSPVTDAGLFPRDGIAWDLNYRGELNFLRQAWAAQVALKLTVVDGWHYFLEGWSEVIRHVFDVEITPPLFDALARAAAAARG